jgi:hypothetical protein
MHKQKDTSHITPKPLPKIKLFDFSDELWLPRQTDKFFHDSNTSRLPECHVAWARKLCHLIFIDPQYETCLMPLFWDTEFSGIA